jgi:predicted CXXCH cytochrome family protein
MKKTLPAIFMVAFVLSATAALAGLAGSKHDLTRDERESYTTEDGAACIFCHIPHGDPGVSGSQGPLWAQQQKGEPLQYFALYSWEGRVGEPAVNKPDWSTLNCLSCHDGAIGPSMPNAIFEAGSLPEAPGAARSGGAYAPPRRMERRSIMVDHPVGAFYKQGRAGLAGLPAVKDKGLKLFGAVEDRIECASCHNPHTTKNERMLEKLVNDLCAACHEKRSSGKHVLGSSGLGDNHPIAGKPDPLRPEKKLTCASCHDPHASSPRAPFAGIKDKPANLCLLCHKKITVAP